MKTTQLMPDGTKVEYPTKDSRSQKALDFAGLGAIIAAGILGWTLPFLSAIPGFNILLYSAFGTRVAAANMPASDRPWVSAAKNALLYTMYAMGAAVAITAAVVFSGAASVTTAIALPWMCFSLAGLGLLHAGVSFFNHVRDYLNTPVRERTPLMKHGLRSAAFGFLFQAALVATLACALAIPGAQPLLLLAIPLAIAGKAIVDFLYMRPKTEELAKKEGLLNADLETNALINQQVVAPTVQPSIQAQLDRHAAQQQAAFAEQNKLVQQTLEGRLAALQAAQPAPAVAPGERVEVHQPMTLDRVDVHESKIEASVGEASTVRTPASAVPTVAETAPVTVTTTPITSSVSSAGMFAKETLPSLAPTKPRIVDVNDQSQLTRRAI